MRRQESGVAEELPRHDRDRVSRDEPNAREPGWVSQDLSSGTKSLLMGEILSVRSSPIFMVTHFGPVPFHTSTFRFARIGSRPNPISFIYHS